MRQIPFCGKNLPWHIASTCSYYQPSSTLENLHEEEGGWPLSLFLEKCDRSSCLSWNPSRMFNRVLMGLKCMCAFFRRLIKLKNFWIPDCAIAIGKIPCLSWLIRKGLYTEKFWKEQRNLGLDEEWSLGSYLAVPSLLCCVKYPAEKTSKRKRITDIRLAFKKYFLICVLVGLKS